MTASVAIRAKPSDASWFDELPQKLAEAADLYDLAGRPDWAPIGEISPDAALDRIETYGDLAVREGRNLVAPGTLYVKIPDPDGDGQPTFAERFPIRLFFNVDQDDGGTRTVEVKRIDIDTKSFFG